MHDVLRLVLRTSILISLRQVVRVTEQKSVTPNLLNNLFFPFYHPLNIHLWMDPSVEVYPKVVVANRHQKLKILDGENSKPAN